MTAKRMDKLISKYTSAAASGSIIRIFGGDLNFFGDYGAKKNNIENNSQVAQINKLALRNIRVQIICIKPTLTIQKQRIGYLKSNCPNIEFGFYQTGPKKPKDCRNCNFDGACHLCKAKNCCDQFNNMCPDLKFRGRIITRNGGANYVLIANWISDKDYEILKVYKPDSKECNFYVKYWDFIWSKVIKYKNNINKILKECEDSI